MGFTHTFAVVERDAITRLSTSCCFKPRTSGEEINAQFLSILSFLSRIHVYDASSGDARGETENTRPLEAYVEDVRRRESKSNGCENEELTP
uniref:Uncharacterized protein LOC104242402 isoform X3 n=1 Tax=Nicotiana sylvestris TaxID=4096 RepID=A0A1U7YA81_NICSY|nr:PREDICTED: uncharacterized protein LOC104242402 isoform X3 [Nicotiana sylvestris]